MSEILNNILIIKPSSLGDIVMALPALSALRRNFPKSKITWLIRPEFASILEGHPDIDNIILFDRRFLGRAWYNPKAFASLLLLIKQLKKNKFDAVIDLQGLFRTASLAWLSGCKKRFGLADARELAHIFYTHTVTKEQDSAHVVDYYLKVIQAVGASGINVEFVLPQDPAAVDSVESLLTSRRIKPGNYAVLVPGSAHKSKCWPADNFAALADKITSDFAISIILVGTEPEKVITQKIASKATAKVEDFAGLTTLPELVALFRKAAVVVTNDTGPGHIAVALGIPLVMIFGPSNPIRIFPYCRPETVAAVDPFRRGPKLQSTNPAHAIDAITVDEVYKKVCEQIK